MHVLDAAINGALRRVPAMTHDMKLTCSTLCQLKSCFRRLKFTARSMFAYIERDINIGEVWLAVLHCSALLASRQSFKFQPFAQSATAAPQH